MRNQILVHIQTAPTNLGLFTIYVQSEREKQKRSVERQLVFTYFDMHAYQHRNISNFNHQNTYSK